MMMNNFIRKLPNLITKSNKSSSLLLNNGNTSKIIICTTVSNINNHNNQNNNNNKQFYSTLSKKKFDQIKEKRDEETRNLKEEKERLFIQQNKISIEELPFDAALQNVTEKFEKYHAVANHLVGTMFRKVSTVEELHQLLGFYKKMKNSNPNYFRASDILFIYYAFLRTEQIPLLAEIIIHSDKFQIFPKMNIIIKVISQLLCSKPSTAEQIELASQMLAIYKLRHSLSKTFMTTLSKSLAANDSIPSLLPMLKLFPTDLPLDIGSATTKYIIRDSYKGRSQGKGRTNIQPTLDVIYRFTTEDAFNTQYDEITKSVMITFELIANPTIEQHRYTTALSGLSVDNNLFKLVVKNFEKLLSSDSEASLVSENTKNNIKRSIDTFNNQLLKDSLKSFL